MLFVQNKNQTWFTAINNNTKNKKLTETCEWLFMIDLFYIFIFMVILRNWNIKAPVIITFYLCVVSEH